jgi:hypothetical protein
MKDYTGIGPDTIGPAAYDVRQDPTKAGGPRVNFARSSKRKILFGGPEATKVKQNKLNIFLHFFNTS